MYTASLTMNMTGSRENLQSMLDVTVSQEPRQRVTNFSWQKNQKEGSSEYTLSMTVDIYMYQDVEMYVQKQLLEALSTLLQVRIIDISTIEVDVEAVQKIPRQLTGMQLEICLSGRSSLIDRAYTTNCGHFYCADTGWRGSVRRDDLDSLVPV